MIIFVVVIYIFISRVATLKLSGGFNIDERQYEKVNSDFKTIDTQ
jgi:hypothetical protein